MTTLPNRIREWRKRRGLSQQELANLVGTSQQQIKRLELGERGLTDSWMYQLAAGLGCHPGDLLLSDQNLQPVNGPIVAIAIRGIVQAGHWSEAAELPETDWEFVQVPSPGSYSDLFGLRVRGRSMDLEYPPGTILVCSPLHFADRDLRPGDHVIVHRTSPDGLVEATVKELRVGDDGRPWLWPRSSQPEFQAPIALPDGPLDDTDPDVGERIEIVALVVADYRVRKPV